MGTENDQEKSKQKEQLYRLVSQVSSALANPHRLELIDLLAQAPRTVEELAQGSRMTVGNTSQHLQRLKQARLVCDQRQGVHISYRLADPAVADLWVELRAVARRQLAEMERALDAYRDQRNEFETLSAEALIALLRTGEAVLLDVRPVKEYEAGHLPEAISIPLKELPRRLAEIPCEKTMVAYCRGPYCADADQALALAAERGWKVARLEDGVLEWQRKGYPIITNGGMF